MIRRVLFTVEGKAQPKERPRMGKNGVITPKKTKIYERRVAMDFIRAVNEMEDYVNFPMTEEPVQMEIRIYYPIPKSDSKATKAAKECGEIPCTVKFDVDNVAKSIMDALNGHLYKDDGQVNEVHIYKSYSINPRVEVDARW